MKMLLVIALAILSGHACAAGRPTLTEIPAPVRSTLIHVYLEDDDPDKFSELFFESAVIDDLPGAIVTWRVNNGREVRQRQHRFILPEKNERFCSEESSVMRHAVDGKVIGDENWKVALPIDWDDRGRPNRSYTKGTSPTDIIGTELCIAHFSTFGDDLEERTSALLAERKRQWNEKSALRDARYEEDVATYQTCLQDREVLERASESTEREAGRLSSSEDRLAVMRASLDLQRGIRDSYTPSAASTRDFNRQVQAYNGALAEHNRNVKDYDRVLARGRSDQERINAKCSRQFDGAAVRKVCRDNPSKFCPDEKTLR